MRLTDEQITELETEFNVKLLDYQKEMLKKLLLPDSTIIIPRRSGYRHTLLLLAHLNNIIMIVNKKEK